MIGAVLEFGISSSVCTIYDANYPERTRQRASPLRLASPTALLTGAG
jgi:hypothetical protein